MDISCAFATSSGTPKHVELAESLGYRRAWLDDSPALYPDVWMILPAATAVLQVGQIKKVVMAVGGLLPWPK